MRVANRLKALPVGFLLCFALVLIVVSSNSAASSIHQPTEKRLPVRAMPLPKATSEMDKLSFLVGTWDAADKYEKSQLTPNGGEGSGVYKTASGPGGFSLLLDFHFQAPQGEASGHQILTWDLKQSRYMGYIVVSAFPGCLVVTGNWEGADLVFSGDFPEIGGTKVSVKDVFSDITGRTMTLHEYLSINGGPAQLFVTSKLTKR